MTITKHESEKETLLQTKSKNNVTIATYIRILTKSTRTYVATLTLKTLFFD